MVLGYCIQPAGWAAVVLAKPNLDYTAHYPGRELVVSFPLDCEPGSQVVH